MIRFVAMDIDGTLLSSSSSIGQRTLSAIRKAMDLGVKFSLVTGRRLSSAIPIARAIGDVAIVCHNGAIAKGSPDGDVVYSRPMTSVQAVATIRAFVSGGMFPILYRGTKGYAEMFVERDMLRSMPPPIRHWISEYLERNEEFVRMVDGIEGYADGETVEVMAPVPTKDVVDLMGYLESEIGDRGKVLRMSPKGSDVSFLEVVSPLCSKWNAVAFLAGSMGVSREGIMAIGDNYNDVDMLLSAGIGVLMGNAPDELKSLGLYITSSNEEDGVGIAIERFVLGPFIPNPCPDNRRGEPI